MSYYQAQAFKYVRANPGATTLDIASALGMPGGASDRRPERQATQVLQHLRRKGLVRLRARRCDGWEAVPGARLPKDMRGKTQGSLVALSAHSRTNVLKALAKRGRFQRPQPTTELEKAWGWMRTSPELQAQNEADMLIGGTVRPKNREAA